MKTKSLRGTGRKLLAATILGAVLLPFSTAVSGWWGPVVGWDPHEAYLEEYGFLDRYGPTPGDLRRMHRDNWRAYLGYPVQVDNVGPWGPRPSDVRRQHHRKMRRAWGYYY